jgi:subtilisin-like proprotein convertase family protein
VKVPRSTKIAIAVSLALSACAALGAAGSEAAVVITPNETTVSDAKPGGDGDGFLEPTESFTLNERVKNDSGVPLTSVTASLASVFPASATIDQPISGYPDMPTGGIAENVTAFHGSVPAGAGVCGSQATMQLNLATAQGTGSTTFTLPINGKRTTYGGATNVPIAIPDNNPAGVTSDIVLPPGVGNVVDVNPGLVITHTFNADLDVSLTHGATTVSLFTDVNGGGDGMGTASSPLLLDDEASTAIETAAVPAPGTPLTGTFRPETPASLSAFDGMDASGTWTLKVVDDSAGDLGTLESWTVDNSAPCNRSPVASFVVAPDPASPGQAVDVVSTSRDFDGSIASVAWDLDNDGAFDDAAGDRASRTFASAGTFPVGLKVTDNVGDTGTLTQSVHVVAPTKPRLAVTLARMRRQKLGAALKHGLRLRVTLNAAATIRASASLSSALARRFGLISRSVVVARGTKKGKAGSNTVVVKFSRKAKTKLKHARRLKLRVAVSAADASGARSAASRSVTLKR